MSDRLRSNSSCGLSTGHGVPALWPSDWLLHAATPRSGDGSGNEKQKKK